MSVNKTPNYELNLPGYDEFADIEDLNENSNIIDGLIKGISDGLEAVPTVLNLTATMGTTWTGSGPYTQSRSVAGILSSDTPIIGPNFPSNLASRRDQKDAWNLVSMITTSNGSITITCDDAAPTTAVALSILIVRGA